jgi:hypothetical protein
MKRLARREEGILLLFLILFLLTALSLGLPLTVYGDGIGQPSDGLNSTPPPSGGTPSSLEPLLLYVALSLLI